MSDISNIVDLLKQLRDDTTTLVREEVALAKTEMSEKVAVASRNTAFLAAGGLLAYSALLLILLAIAFLIREQFVSRGMGEGTATCLGLLIVGTVVGIVSLILITKALAALKIASLAPHKIIETLKDDKQWAQSKVS